jgi:hypothetical protein
MTVAIAQVVFVVLFIILTYFHSSSTATSDAKDHKAHYPATTPLTTGVEMGFLLILVMAILYSLGMGYKVALMIPIGYCLWRATYELGYGQEMGNKVDLSDVSAEIMFLLVCLLGLL